MNERIDELMRQASKFAAENKTQTISGLGNNYFELLHEKFAELIVAECILTIQMGITRDGPNTEKYLRSIKHITQIKEHFGVEE